MNLDAALIVASLLAFAALGAVGGWFTS